MIELGVNIDHVATLRQARRTYEPDPVWAAVEAHLGGADGITVHLREDRRHIQDEDVRRLRELVHIKLNLEMAATDEMIDIAVRAQARDGDARAGRARTRSRPKAVSTSPAQEAKLARGRASGSPTPASCVSVFIDAELAAGRGRGAHRRAGSARSTPVRMRTRSTPRAAIRESAPVVAELAKIRAAGEAIRRRGMRFNAGHALNYFNVQPVAALPGVRELHIGHAIVSRAVFVGTARGGAADEGADAGSGARARMRACDVAAARAGRSRRRGLELDRRRPRAPRRIRWSAA